MKSLRGEFVTWGLCFVVAVCLTGYAYFDFQWKSSDRYAISAIEKGDCELLRFPDGSWMKMLVFPAGEIPPRHGGFMRGAVYLMDSHGHMAKISGGYVKPRVGTYNIVKYMLSECNSVEEAWTNDAWEAAMPKSSMSLITKLPQ